MSWLLNAISESSIKLKTLTDEKEKQILASLRAPKVSPSGQDDRLRSNQELGLKQHLGSHKILFLNDTMHEITPINVMMSWYGEADGGGSCSEDFGISLINRWRDIRKPYCSAKVKAVSDIGEQSSIDCFLVHQTRHHGEGDNLCLMKNVALNIGEIAI